MVWTNWLLLLAGLYLGMNFLCALLLHRHADRQAHLPVRFLDILVHFVLLTLFAIPALLVITAEAIFGHEPKLKHKPMSSVGARAA